MMNFGQVMTVRSLEATAIQFVIPAMVHQSSTANTVYLMHFLMPKEHVDVNIVGQEEIAPYLMVNVIVNVQRIRTVLGLRPGTVKNE